MTRYAVLRADLDGNPPARLGVMELDDQNTLHLIEADAAAKEALEKAVADLNGRNALTIKLPPEDTPVGEDGEKDSFGIQKIKVGRADPRFFDAVQDNLRRWHEMELSPG